MIDDVLSTLEALLSKSDINYTVFLRSYRLPVIPDRTTQELVSEAIGDHAIVGGASPIGVTEMIHELTELLRYRGDSSAGPDPKALDSKEFSALLDKLVNYFLDVGNAARRIERFWLKDGHPAYPVFWDFAYLIERDTEVEIFLGCSSD